MSDRPYLSIGEVLSLLQDEFPDVTISKIRFLESQGLIDPERTPSGYRKFYDPDVERLRFILRAQKERFLPLKVIKDRLESGEEVGDEPGEPAALDEPGDAGPPTVALGLAGAPGGRPGSRGSADAGPGPVREAPRDEHRPAAQSSETGAAVVALPAGRARAASRGGSHPSAGTGGPPGTTAAGERVPVWMQRDRPPSRLAAATAAPGGPGASYTFEELAAASGCTPAQLRELESYGLLAGRALGSVVSYDADALGVARSAAVCFARGIEARHLRMFKVGAEREAGLYEQVVLPLVKQRNPTSRAQALETLEELARAGGELREAMLRQALRPYTSG